MSVPDHDQELAAAFDGQAAQFERAPVQTDPGALARLVAFANLPPDSLILDPGCGPGLVSEAFLNAGHRVFGLELSREMASRARVRCERFGERARFEISSLFNPSAYRGIAFDAAVSRYVLHHVSDPRMFIENQADRLRVGGILVVCDHVTDPDPSLYFAQLHQRAEQDRDRTHVRNLTSGELVNLLGEAGMADVSMTEERFSLDFDEWFDRGTTSMPKQDVRERLLTMPPIRGFDVIETGQGAIRIDCVRVTARGVKLVDQRSRVTTNTRFRPAFRQPRSETE